MIFKSGDRVSIKGSAGARTVMDIQGDLVGVLEYDPQAHVMRRQTYKADLLQLAPRPVTLTRAA